MSCLSLFQADDVNRTLEGGRKPLHIAADFGQTEVMEYLILKGAEIDVRATATTASSHHTIFALICLLSRVAVTTKITVPTSDSLHSPVRSCSCQIKQCNNRPKAAWLIMCYFGHSTVVEACQTSHLSGGVVVD